jgi:hypothetical protein
LLPNQIDDCGGRSAGSGVSSIFFPAGIFVEIASPAVDAAEEIVMPPLGYFLFLAG